MFSFVFVGSTKRGLANSDDLQVMLEDRSIVDDEDVFSEFPPNTCFYLIKNVSKSDGALATNSSSIQFANNRQKRLMISEGNIGLRMPLESVSKYLS